MPNDLRAALAAMKDDVPRADWYSREELETALEHHGADPDRIESDAVLMSLAPALVDALTTVLDLHRPDVFSATMRYYCTHCRRREVAWPCPTVRAITEKLEGLG